MFSCILLTSLVTWGSATLCCRSCRMCWWLTVSKALAMPMNTTPSSLYSLLGDGITGRRSFQFSEDSAALIKPLYLGLRGHDLVNLAVIILENSLNKMEPIVMVSSYQCPLNNPVWLTLVLIQSCIPSPCLGFLSDVNQRLKISMVWENSGSIFLRSLRVIPSGPGAEFLLISCTFFSISLAIIKSLKALLSAFPLIWKFPRLLNLPGVSHLALNAE